ncbi:MAG: sigma-70 family RNA polymerase sigma factor [Chloroflexi bacterium]|nr:sigma-70 family RNA polymerase sigma factor [Chloroflexota bacterium]
METRQPKQESQDRQLLNSALHSLSGAVLNALSSDETPITAKSSTHIDPLGTLRKVESMVRRFLRESLSVDPESVASDIWLDLWTRGAEPSWQLVRNRCIDAIRRRALHAEVYLPEHDELEIRAADTRTPQERLSQLFLCPWISSHEKQVLYNCYYAGRTDEVQAGEFSVSRETVTKTRNTALDKLRHWAFVQEQESEVETA